VLNSSVRRLQVYLPLIFAPWSAAKLRLTFYEITGLGLISCVCNETRNGLVVCRWGGVEEVRLDRMGVCFGPPIFLSPGCFV
jgi:hypothetical protein